MRLHEDDSHIVEEQEQRKEALLKAIGDEDNCDILAEAICDSLSYRSHWELIDLFHEFSDNGWINKDRYYNELIQRETDKRKEV